MQPQGPTADDLNTAVLGGGRSEFGAGNSGSGGAHGARFRLHLTFTDRGRREGSVIDRRDPTPDVIRGLYQLR